MLTAILGKSSTVDVRAVVAEWEKTFPGKIKERSLNTSVLLLMSHISAHYNGVMTSETLDKAVKDLYNNLDWDVAPPAPKPQPLFQMGDKSDKLTHAQRERLQEERQAKIVEEMNDVNSTSFQMANSIAQAELEKIRSSYCVILPSGKVDHGRTQDRRKILNEIIAYSKQLDANGNKVRHYIKELEFIKETALPAFQREDEHRNYA